jgi:hypothetical protein
MLGEIMAILWYILAFILLFNLLPISIFIGSIVMDMIYLCGYNPNSNSSINGELPKTWIDQTNDEISRFVLVACKEHLKLKHNTTKVCGLPPLNILETAKPTNIKNIFYSTYFEDFLEICNASIVVDYPKSREDIMEDKCVAYLRVEDDVIFTIHYYKDSYCVAT